MRYLKTITMTIAFAIIFFVIGCGSIDMKEKETGAKTNITSLQIEPYGQQRLILRFSNIIYDYDGENVRFPIFQGTFGDVQYKDYYNYCVNNGILKNGFDASGFVIKCRKGEIRKTLYEFIAFYKSNILKNVNIDKPLIEYAEGMCGIWYEFNMNGKLWSLCIKFVPADQKTYKSVFDLKPDENVADTSFMFRFE